MSDNTKEPEQVNRQAALRRGFHILLEVQTALQDKLFWPSGHGGLQMAKDNLLHTHSEIDEILREINWKPHKAYRPGTYGTLRDRTAFVMEITDAFQTLANVALAYGVTADELAQALTVKWGINFEDAAEKANGGTDCAP
jgi:hypothetical protein